MNIAMKRRRFLQTAGGAAGLVLPATFRRAFGSAQVFQTPLAGKDIPRYVDPMPTFAGNRVTGSSITVSMEEFQQKVLPAVVYAPLAPPFNVGTYVWGYKVGARPHQFPGFTIEAKRGISTVVTYVNNLPNPPVLQKYLTVDQTIHFADPLMQMGSFAPYAGPPPLVAHLHGAEVPSEFDGHPDAWF